MTTNLNVGCPNLFSRTAQPDESGGHGEETRMTKVTLDRINTDTYESVEPVTLDIQSEEFKEAAVEWLVQGRLIDCDKDDYWDDDEDY